MLMCANETQRVASSSHLQQSLSATDKTTTYTERHRQQVFSLSIFDNAKEILNTFGTVTAKTTLNLIRNNTFAKLTLLEKIYVRNNVGLLWKHNRKFNHN